MTLSLSFELVKAESCASVITQLKATKSAPNVIMGTITVFRDMCDAC